MNPKVSVIVPVYNAEKFLPQCLDSIIHQTLKDIEIICVNDGSTDNSLKILHQYAANDSRIKVINQANQGLSGARNIGISKAVGEYIGFVDSDDWIDLDFYEKLYEIATKKDADLVRTCALYHLPNSKTQAAPFNKILKKLKHKPIDINQHDAVVWNAIYRTSVIKENRIFFDNEERFGSEDVLWTAQMAYYAKKAYACTKTFYHCRRTEKDTLASNMDSIARINSMAIAFINSVQYASHKDYIGAIGRCFWRYAHYFVQNYTNCKFSRPLQKKFLKLWVSDWVKCQDKEEIYQSNPFPVLTKKDWLELSEKELLKKLNDTFIKTVIISLTSYPARIPSLHWVIESLLNQTLKADKIVLWLANEEFPNKEKDLPEQLLKMQDKGLEIQWCSYMRSYQKLVPALSKYPDTLIITVDDDAIYQNDIVERLLRAYVQNPKMIHTLRAHGVVVKNKQVMPYQNWEFEIKMVSPSYNNFQTGVGGVLYPPHVLHPDVLDETKFMKLTPQNDDIWFWAMAVHNGTKINLVKGAGNLYSALPGTQDACLWKTNVTEGKNDIQLKAVLNAYPDLLTKIEKKGPALDFKIAIPLYQIKKNSQKMCIKILGIPVWKIKQKPQKNKYYLFGIPVWKKPVK